MKQVTQAGNPANSGYIFGGMVGGVVGGVVGLGLHWHWLYVLAAIPAGLVVGSFYPGVGLALLFAAGTGDASRRDRRVRVIHGWLFVVGPLAGALAGLVWGWVGLLSGAVAGALLSLGGAVVVSTWLMPPVPDRSFQEKVEQHTRQRRAGHRVRKAGRKRGGR